MPPLTLLALAWLIAMASTAPETSVEPWTGMAFVRIPAGRFVMGSPEGEPGREPQETPHEVDLTRPFEIGAYEVTQAQWQKVMGWNRSTFRGATRPVEQVNWLEIQEFLRRLTAHSEGVRFRLPSEAEWEYACRAGATTAYAAGDTLSQTAANYGGKETTPVGHFAPNAWGLYDMSGNVWEWTADEHCPYAGNAVTDPRPACGSDLKVIRGGSWYFGADSARCALRYTHPPRERGFSLGLRVVRVLQPGLHEAASRMRPIRGPHAPNRDPLPGCAARARAPQPGSTADAVPVAEPVSEPEPLTHRLAYPDTVSHDEPLADAEPVADPEAAAAQPAADPADDAALACAAAHTDASALTGVSTTARVESTFAQR